MATTSGQLAGRAPQREELSCLVFNTDKPPHVDDDMMDRMRTILSFCVFGQLFSMFIAGGRASSSDTSNLYAGSGMGWAAFLIALIAWLLYAGFPLGLVPCLRGFDEVNDFNAEDTMDIPYDKVTEIKLYEIEYYECPAARRGDQVVNGYSLGVRQGHGAPSGLPPQPPSSTCYPPQPTASRQAYPQSGYASSYPSTTQLQQTRHMPQSMAQGFQDI